MKITAACLGKAQRDVALSRSMHTENLFIAEARQPQRDVALSRSMQEDTLRLFAYHRVSGIYVHHTENLLLSKSMQEETLSGNTLKIS